MSKCIDSEKLIAELTKMQFTLNAAYRKPQSDNTVRAISLEYDDILSLVESIQQEQPENEEKIMNFFDALGDCGFSQHDILLMKNIWKEAGCPPPKSQIADASKMEHPEVDLEKFTEKIKTFQARYKHPEIVSIKGAMAFMARMFYQYPNVARLWYEQLPKATMD